MKRVRLANNILTVTGMLACALLALTLASPVWAKDHGFINGVRMDAPKEGVFRVNIEKIDGRDANSAPSKEVKAGSHEVEVSLVFDPIWGTGMNMTEDNIYYKTMSFDVEAGKYYTLGAKVNTHATLEEQKDGSFWEPIIYKTR